MFQPDEDSWSLGQMYNHLLDGTRRYHLAQEWYQLIAMHFRHHLRQKEELTKLALERRASGTN